MEEVYVIYDFLHYTCKKAALVIIFAGQSDYIRPAKAFDHIKLIRPPSWGRH